MAVEMDLVNDRKPRSLKALSDSASILSCSFTIPQAGGDSGMALLMELRNPQHQ